MAYNHNADDDANYLINHVAQIVRKEILGLEYMFNGCSHPGCE